MHPRPLELEPSVFTARPLVGIPPACSMLAAVADLLTTLDPLAVANALVLMPTRRGCRLLERYLLEQAPSQCILLPTILPLGDPDPTLVPLTLRMDLGIPTPPTAHDLIHQTLLAQAFVAKLEWASTTSWTTQWNLARKLVSFYEQVTTQGLDATVFSLWGLSPYATQLLEEDLEGLSFNDGKLRFLEQFLKAWPDILTYHGLVDRGTYRRRLLLSLADHWGQTPPDRFVIAVVSAGLIPPAVTLIDRIRQLPQGHVRVEGVPPHVKAAYAASHPFAVFNPLMPLLTSGPITPLPLQSDSTRIGAIDDLSDRDLRTHIVAQSLEGDGGTSGQDENLDPAAIKRAFANVQSYQAASPEDEAFMIAATLRDALETPHQTAALVTPDRLLARRVRAHLARWGISVDDSAGTPLESTFFAQSLHQMMQLGYHKVAFLELAPVISALLTEGASPSLLAPHMLAMRQKLIAQRRSMVLIPEDLPSDIATALAPLHTAVKDFMAASPASLDVWAQRLGAFIAEHSVIADQDKEAAQAYSAALHDLMTARGADAPMPFATFWQIWSAHVREIAFRSPLGDHPRLLLLGLREARLPTVDLVILGGLNEGTWPSATTPNMWQYTHVQHAAGLPTDADKMSQDGFDFWLQITAAPKVLLTRSVTSPHGPTLPARWLRYLTMMLAQSGVTLKESKPIQQPLQRKGATATQAETLHSQGMVLPMALRPLDVWVTQLETFFQDPLVFAYKVALKLRPLPCLTAACQRPTPQDFGQWIHSALELFTQQRDRPGAGPRHPQFMDTARAIVESYAPGILTNPFWRQRLERMDVWLSNHLPPLEASYPHHQAEAVLGLAYESLSIKGRIDHLHWSASACGLIDYKTGTPPTKGAIMEGTSLQLGLSGLLAQDTHFLQNLPLDHVAYWVFPSLSPYALTLSSDDIAVALNQARTALTTFAAQWQDQDFACRPASKLVVTEYWPLTRQLREEGPLCHTL